MWVRVEAKLLLVAVMLACLGACDRTTSPSTATSQPTANSQASPLTNQWLGRWPGVEGTYLDLAKKGDKYVVTISDLDGPKDFEGKAAGDHIEFTRDGKVESIRHGNGQDVGMKWMLYKKNCLVIHAGEGFCRD